MVTKTRFAPSPTGYLHVGSARTALFAWLFAKKHGGQFVLRIEDTDLQRSTEESVTAIFEGMSWLGLAEDQGPYFQTQRMPLYQETIQTLLNNGDAYYCNCSKDRLQTLRETQMAAKQKPRYDGHCRDLNLSTGDVIRFKNPTQGQVTFKDHVYGDITVANAELDDLIIQRSDGSPTYNLTVVVDDWQMGITHVIRGDDHINNTPRQINILKALAAHVPEYAHLPMILGDDGKRLSKRHGAVGVMQYRDDGYLPHALLNYLVRLGWSHGDQEIFSLKEMIDYFDLDAVSKGAASFNTEKLQWLNQHYLKTLDPEQLVAPLQYQYQQLNIDTNHGPDLTDVIVALRERAKTLKEMAEQSSYFFVDQLQYSPEIEQTFSDDITKRMLGCLHEKLATLTDWQADLIKPCIVDTATEFDVKMGKLMMPLRAVVTASQSSPSIDLTLQLIGQEKVLARICKVIER